MRRIVNSVAALRVLLTRHFARSPKPQVELLLGASDAISRSTALSDMVLDEAHQSDPEQPQPKRPDSLASALRVAAGPESTQGTEVSARHHWPTM